jgi:hypothetical protein
VSTTGRATTARATTAKPIEVSTELKALLRRLKLGRLLDTLPERLALARAEHLPHHDFLEMLLADEVTRRDRQSTLLRAKTAHLERGMHLDAWDESTRVTYDRQLWARADLAAVRPFVRLVRALPMSQGEWRDHFGPAFGHLVAAKRRYDPQQILTPGYDVC